MPRERETMKKIYHIIAKATHPNGTLNGTILRQTRLSREDAIRTKKLMKESGYKTVQICVETID